VNRAPDGGLAGARARRHAAHLKRALELDVEVLAAHGDGAGAHGEVEVLDRRPARGALGLGFAARLGGARGLVDEAHVVGGGDLLQAAAAPGGLLGRPTLGGRQAPVPSTRSRRSAASTAMSPSRRAPVVPAAATRNLSA